MNLKKNLDELVDHCEDLYNNKKEFILRKYKSINEKDVFNMVIGSYWLYTPSLDENDFKYIESSLEKRLFKNK